DGSCPRARSMPSSSSPARRKKASTGRRFLPPGSLGLSSATFQLWPRSLNGAYLRRDAGVSQWQREMKGLVGFLVARPLIAIALAAIVVAVLYFGFTHRQTTPVTHRSERVGLTDQQQMQLGSEQYAKTLRQS